MIRRGDVVIVDFPFADGTSAKVRPALVVQHDRENQLLRKTIVVLITGNLRRLGEPGHLFVDPSAPEGATSGLHAPSLISCINLFTVEQASIIRVIGHLSDPLQTQLVTCLKAVLDLP